MLLKFLSILQYTADGSTNLPPLTNTVNNPFMA